MSNLNLNQQRNITLNQTSPVECENCNNSTFQESFFLRKASRLLTGAPKDSYIPIPVFVCTSCGHVNDEFIPNELKEEVSSESNTKTSNSGETLIVSP